MTFTIRNNVPWRAGYQPLAAVITGVLLITISSKTQIPFLPIPMTMQTFAIFFLAAVMGPRLAIVTMTTYLTLGIMGLPVFAGAPEKGIGLAYLAGPTGGYLVGYLLATAFVGILTSRVGIIARFFAMLAGLGIVYICGLAWLALYVPANALLATGLIPFLAGDLIKIGLATLLVGPVRKLGASAR